MRWGDPVELCRWALIVFTQVNNRSKFAFYRCPINEKFPRVTAVQDIETGKELERGPVTFDSGA
jgi:hypothetical protein